MKNIEEKCICLIYAINCSLSVPFGRRLIRGFQASEMVVRALSFLASQTTSYELRAQLKVI